MNKKLLQHIDAKQLTFDVFPQRAAKPVTWVARLSKDGLHTDRSIGLTAEEAVENLAKKLKL